MFVCLCVCVGMCWGQLEGSLWWEWNFKCSSCFAFICLIYISLSLQPGGRLFNIIAGLWLRAVNDLH